MTEPNRDEKAPPSRQPAKTVEIDESDLDFADIDDEDEENAAASDRMLEEDDAPLPKSDANPLVLKRAPITLDGNDLNRKIDLVGDGDFVLDINLVRGGNSVRGEDLGRDIIHDRRFFSDIDFPNEHPHRNHNSDFEDSYNRHEIVSSQMFKTLLAQALKNPNAEAILSDITDPDAKPSRIDPLWSGIRLLQEETPQQAANLKRAVMKGMQLDSNAPIEHLIAKTAAENPQFAQHIRQIINNHLSKGRHEEQGKAVSLMFAMSPQWSVEDFQTALRHMQPNQVQDFRTALSYAPPEVQREAFNFAANEKRDLFENVMKNSHLKIKDGYRPLFDSISDPKEFAAMQSRMHLIIGENINGQPLWNVGTRGEKSGQLQLGRPSASDPLGLGLGNKHDFFGLNTIRERVERAKALFNAGFPDHSRYEMDKLSMKRHIDSRYLHPVLTENLERTTSKPIKSEDVFARWGVDTSEFKKKIDEAKMNYGEETILALDKRLAMFNALDPASRVKFAGEGNENRIESSIFAGMLLNGEINKTSGPGAFLLGEPPFEQRVGEAHDKRASETKTEALLLAEKMKLKEDNLALLEQYTSNGVRWYELLGDGADKLLEVGLYTSPAALFVDVEKVTTSGVEAFADKQRNLLHKLRDSETELAERAQKEESVSSEEAQLQFASRVHDYETLAQSNASTERKDYLALMMLDHYGIEKIKERAPQIYNDLAQGGFKRLADRRLIETSDYPDVSGDHKEQIAKAIEIAATRTKPTGDFLDTNMRQRQALDVFDDDKSLQSSQKTLLAFGEKFDTYSRLFKASNEGTKYEDIVKNIKGRASELEKIMTSVSQQDIRGLKDLGQKLDEAIKGAQDPEIATALRAKAASVKSALDVLDPNSEQHKKLLDSLKDAQTRNFSPDTLGTWLRENGPVIAVTAVAVAITLSTMGTGAPIAAVLVSSAVAVCASQVTSEALYLINHNITDTGLGGWNNRSYAGAWGAKHYDEVKHLITSSDLKDKPLLAAELYASYIKEVSTPLTAEYAQNVVMGLVGLGALRLGQAGFSGLNASWVKSLVANPRSLEMIKAANRTGLNASSKGAMTSWLKSIALESGKDTLEELGEEGVSTVAEKALQQANLNSPVASVLLAVSMGVAKGRAGGHGSERMHGNTNVEIPAGMKNDVLDTLKKTGHHVETLPDGSISASSYSTPKERVRISIAESPASLNQTAARRPRSTGGGQPFDMENRGRHFASGDPNDSLGPDNRLRQTTLRRQIDDSFPPEFRDAAKEQLVMGGEKRQAILQRMLKLGSDKCGDVLNLLKSKPDLETLTAKVHQAEALDHVKTKTDAVAQMAEKNSSPGAQKLRTDATESTKTLKSLLESGKISPDAAMNIADCMTRLANKGSNDAAAMSPATVEVLAGLTDQQVDTFTNDIPSAQQRQIVDALNLKFITPAEFSPGLTNPSNLAQNLQSMQNSIARFKPINDSADVSPQVVDALRERAKGRTSGDELIDSVFTSKVMNSADPAQLSEAAKLLSKHLESKLDRSPEIIGKLFSLSPAISSDVAQLIQTKGLSDPNLNRVLTELSGVADSKELLSLARSHRSIAAMDPKLHADILSFDNPNTRKALMAGLSAIDVSTDATRELRGQAREVIQSQNTSPEFRSALDKILAAPGTMKERIVLANAAVDGKLTSGEVGHVAKLLESQHFTLPEITSLAKCDAVNRAKTLEMAASRLVADKKLVQRIADDSQAGAISEAILNHAMDSKQAAELMNGLEVRHANKIKAILKEHMDSSNPIKGDALKAMMETPSAAFHMYVDLPDHYHSDPNLAPRLREVRDLVEKISSRLDAEGKANIDHFLTEQFEFMYSGDRTEMNRHGLKHFDPQDSASMLSQLEFLEKAISKSPADTALLKMAAEFPNSAMQVNALMAGVRGKIPDGDFVVLLHGTDLEFANEAVDQSGRNINSTHVSSRVKDGANKGLLSTTDSIRAARIYARMSNSENRGGAGIVAVAIPRDLYNQMKAQIIDKGELLHDAGNNRIGLASQADVWGQLPPLQLGVGKELALTPEAYKQLYEKGLFFRMDAQGNHNPTINVPKSRGSSN
jgi:hypothetical protein